MPPKPSWVTLTAEQQNKLELCVKPGEWRIIPGSDLRLFSRSDRVKIDSAVVIATPTSTGGTYLSYVMGKPAEKPTGKVKQFKRRAAR